MKDFDPTRYQSIQDMMMALGWKIERGRYSYFDNYIMFEEAVKHTPLSFYNEVVKNKNIRKPALPVTVKTLAEIPEKLWRYYKSFGEKWALDFTALTLPGGPLADRLENSILKPPVELHCHNVLTLGNFWMAHVTGIAPPKPVEAIKIIVFAVNKLGLAQKINILEFNVSENEEFSKFPILFTGSNTVRLLFEAQSISHSTQQLSAPIGTIFVL